jgi:DNA-binding transcriptional ArsR family regulator
MKRISMKRSSGNSSAKRSAELRRNAARAAELLKAMSNPFRLMVLCSLAEGEKSVGELERVVGLSQSALSQHLARLRSENIVAARRSGQTVFYTLSGKEARSVLETLYRVYCEPVSATLSTRQPEKQVSAGSAQDVVLSRA